jgi:type I restriction enzyme S subunit
MVPLGEVVAQSKEYIDAPEARTYPKLSVKLYGKGVALDVPTDGANLKMKRHQLAKAGQVILSEIWGKKGAIGFVPPEGEGALCTSHFFLFDVDGAKVVPKWLEYIFEANFLEEQLDFEAKGTTGYAAVRPAHFMKATVPLPPLPEQRRLVERIAALAEKIDEAISLQRQGDQGLEAICRSILGGSGDGACRPTPLAELVRFRKPDVDVKADETYQFAGVYCFGRGVFVGQRKTGMNFKYTRLTRLKAGNLVYPKLMAWEGALGIVPPDCDGLVVSPEFPVFEVDESRVLPEVLDVYFRTPSVWPTLSGASTGTNVRRRRLNPADFLRHDFPLPPITTQRKLQEVKRRVEEGRQYRESAAKELAAMLPAILDRAFRGEL